MNLLYAAGCRLYQKGLHGAMYLLPWREPEIASSLEAAKETLARAGVKKPLIVTDQGLARAGLLARLQKAIDGTPSAVYDGTVPNPTIDNIEAACALYIENGCDGLIALGGGSPMDCAKAVGARIARPSRPIEKMRGQMRVLRRLPPLLAIPTTAGTGSEVTLAAVVTNEQTHEKYAINDISLIPSHAILDAALTCGLPPHITSATGMDALTHAVEAYIGRSNTKKTRENSLEAIALIDRWLFQAYTHGDDLQARAGMQRAAYLAGAAFTRAYVGYVHAIAHQLGALYGVPHGLANAILLPHVLAFYGKAAEAPLAALSEAFGIAGAGRTQAEKARAVIEKIREMNRRMDIPDRVREIQTKDIPRIVEGARKEGNPLYPVPRILSRDELTRLVAQLMP